MKRLFRFVGRVLVNFGRNKGLLLASAVAYNTLLSVVPLFAVLLASLSMFFDESQLLVIVEGIVSRIAPGQSSAITAEIHSFLDSRELLGWGGLAVAIFFSTLAFRMLEDAMALIFRRNRAEKRSYWVSAIIPYVYILVVGFGIFCLTVLSTVLDGFSGRDIVLMGLKWSGSYTPSVVLGVFSFFGLVMMFTSLYVVMPAARVEFKRALVGGLTVAVLWELVRLVLVWYFENLSVVSVVYGSLASVVIVLFCMEIAAIIILLGAQIIAELERSAEAGLKWWEAPVRRAAGGGEEEEAPALETGAE